MFEACFGASRAKKRENRVLKAFQKGPKVRFFDPQVNFTWPPGGVEYSTGQKKIFDSKSMRSQLSNAVSDVLIRLLEKKTAALRRKK